MKHLPTFEHTSACTVLLESKTMQWPCRCTSMIHLKRKVRNIKNMKMRQRGKGGNIFCAFCSTNVPSVILRKKEKTNTRPECSKSGNDVSLGSSFPLPRSVLLGVLCNVFFVFERPLCLSSLYFHPLWFRSPRIRPSLSLCATPSTAKRQQERFANLSQCSEEREIEINSEHKLTQTFATHPLILEYSVR